MKKIHILHGICMAVLIILLVYIGVTFKANIFDSRDTEGYTRLTDYDVESQTLADGQILTRYTFNNIDVKDGRQSLIFYTLHQNVTVYVGDEHVYSLKVSSNNLFGKTPGKSWNEIPIYDEDAGKSIVVETTAVYGSLSNGTPEFYYGVASNIKEDVIMDNLPPFVLGAITVIAGIFLMIYGNVVYRQTDSDGGIIMLGLFSVLIGIWKISDINLMALMYPHYVVTSYISLAALLLVIIPFTSYVMKVFGEDSKLWNIPCVMSIIVTAVAVVLQLAGIKDMRETLWLTHACFVVLALTYLVVFIRELRIRGWNGKMKVTVICFIMCLAGMLTDVMIFYGTGGKTSSVGLTVYLLFIIIFSVISIKDINRMVYIGRRADAYRDLAYHDQMTGLYSRAAYATDMDQVGGRACKYFVVMLDLNNLKRCNDTYGHAKGDLYIKSSAAIINDVFGQLGKCYRIGGDEFCVYLENIKQEVCEELKQKLKAEVAKWNEENDEPFTMEIACGSAKYDPDRDYDLHDTIRRADQIMYQEKFSMKADHKQYG